MTSRVDVSQLNAFAARLELAASQVESQADDYEREWGEEWADEMRATVAVGDEAPHLRDQIEQVDPGVITFGGDEFDYALFLEYGTSRMAPQPFIRPAANRIRKPAAEDAAKKAAGLIARG